MNYINEALQILYFRLVKVIRTGKWSPMLLPQTCLLHSTNREILLGICYRFPSEWVSSAVLQKKTAAPIELVKLLIRYQDEMIKTWWLSQPYKGIKDFFSRIMKDKWVFHCGEALRRMWFVAGLRRPWTLLLKIISMMFHFKNDRDIYWNDLMSSWALGVLLVLLLFVDTLVMLELMLPMMGKMLRGKVDSF